MPNIKARPQRNMTTFTTFIPRNLSPITKKATQFVSSHTITGHQRNFYDNCMLEQEEMLDKNPIQSRLHSLFIPYEPPRVPACTTYANIIRNLFVCPRLSSFNKQLLICEWRSHCV